MVHNKADEAEKVFSSIAVLNKKQLPHENIALDYSEEAVKEGGFLDLLRTRTQLFKTLILWFAW